MLLNELFEISANPDYLRAAERSRSQARDTQRQYWRSPEEKAAARRTELKREKGIGGYTKRHRAANPEMYPTPKAQPAPKLRDPSTEYSDDYSVWAKGRRDTQEQSVAEGVGNIGNKIRVLYQKIYSAGDDAIESMYYDSPIFAQYWDEYEGDLDSIIAEVDASELQVILAELQSAVEDQGLAESGFDNASPMTKNALKADRIRSLKNLIAIAKEQGRQLRVQELELELKKLQGVAEMDKSQPSHGRDGRISHSTYGSRDRGGSTGPERSAKATTADKMMKDAHDAMMRSMSDADKVKKGWRNPNM